jgi:hypothetical protein
MKDLELPRYQQIIVKIQEAGQERLFTKLLDAKLEKIKDDFLSIDPIELPAHQKAGQFLQEIVADLQVVPIPEGKARTRPLPDTIDD